MTVGTGVRIGPHDVQFLTAVGRYSLLSTEDALEVYDGLRPNSVQRRLRLLTRCGLVQSVKLKVWWADDDGSNNGGRIPGLYALTEEGAQMVDEQTGERPCRVLRSLPSPATFWHRREIVRVMRAIDRSCDLTQVARPRWIMEQDQWHAAPKKFPLDQRRLLMHDFGKGVNCHPDLACSLRLGTTELVLYWEVDLSTEGRKQIRKASKTDGYVALFNEQGWKRYWPDVETSHRYLIWVAPTPRRIRSLQDTLRDHPVAPLCRFLSAKQFTSPESLLTGDVWETITGERRPMYRPKPA